MSKELKIEHKPLHCPICGNRFMNVFGQPLPNHSQIRCTTVNGDEMDLGVCDKCIEKGISLETCQAILQGIKDYWIYDIDANKQMKNKEKKARKEYHNSHIINGMVKIINTGKEAEKEARKRGKLL